MPGNITLLFLLYYQCYLLELAFKGILVFNRKYIFY